MEKPEKVLKAKDVSTHSKILGNGKINSLNIHVEHNTKLK